MKMDIGSSQSWWWESHNRPKHSKWLQENLADVEANVQSMLQLIEGDADSFAQRAEMYYKKRPDLLKVVEQFYRGYRSLAERYDQLSGSVRQVPTALQHQYGLVAESPRASPFGKHMSFIKANSVKEPPANDSANESGELSGPEVEAESQDASSVDDKSVEQGHDGDDSSSSSSDVEFDGASQEIQRLHKTVEKLQADNKKLVNKSREKLLQFRETEKRLHGFREEFLRAQKEGNTVRAELVAEVKARKKLEEELRQLRFENETCRGEAAAGVRSIKELQAELEKCKEEENRFQGKEKELGAALRIMKGAALALMKKNRSLLDQISGLTEGLKTNEQLVATRDREIVDLKNEVGKLSTSFEESRETMAGLKSKVSELNREVMGLQEDNRKQRAAVVDRGEEKREVIRQLCFTIDLMNERNHWLEGVLVSAKSKFSEYQKLVAAKKSGWSLF